MELLDSVDLSDLAHFRNGIPHELFARLRRDAPVCRNGGRSGEGFWSITRYGDVVAVNRAPERFSSERRGVMMFDQTSLDGPEQPRMMIEIDPPRHTRYRLLVNRAFTPRMVGVLEPRMREIAGAALDKVCGAGPIDFAKEVANTLPVQIISELLAVPPDDQRHIEELSDRIQAGAAEGAAGGGIATEAIVELCTYANDLAANKRQSLDGRLDPHDVLGNLLAAEIDGHTLTDAEFGLFFLLLVVAGNETTRSALSGGALAFAEHPSEWARLRVDASKLPTAVDEVLRWTSPILYMARTATEDVEVGGQAIAAGERVVVWYASANFDEDVFAEPYRFDIGRSPNEHIAFGAGGPHHCLGANLARLELKVMFDELRTRVTAIDLAGPVEHAGSNFSNGIYSLPVELTVR